MSNPDIEKFFTDPKHQQEREFLGAFVDRHMQNRYAEVAERAKKGEKPGQSVFDFLFGGLFSTRGDGKTFLQRMFDGE